jgi:hypothetical protein
MNSFYYLQHIFDRGSSFNRFGTEGNVYSIASAYFLGVT